MNENDPLANAVASTVPVCQPLVPRQRKIKSFFDSISTKDKKVLDEACANLIFGCNLDLEIANSTFFKTFVKLLRPSCVPPNSTEISTTLFESVILKFESCNGNFKNSPGLLFVKVVDQRFLLKSLQYFLKIRCT